MLSYVTTNCIDNETIKRRSPERITRVKDEDFCLVVGWLLVALMPRPTMDCPILWVNAPKGTGKTTATRFLKRLIDPDAGGTISQVGTMRDFAASVS